MNNQPTQTNNNEAPLANVSEAKVLHFAWMKRATRDARKRDANKVVFVADDETGEVWIVADRRIFRTRQEVRAMKT
jgi:hypothetical protein